MKLKELVDINIGLSLDRKKATGLSEKTYEYRMFSLRSFDKHIYFKENTIENFVAHEKINNQYLTESNCVIARLRAPVHALSIYDSKDVILVTSLMAKLHIIYPEILDSRYLAYFINSNFSQVQLMKNMQGSLVQLAKISDLQDLEITLPALEEQIKLVEFMDCYMQEMNLLNQLIEKKQQLVSAILNQEILKQMKEKL